MAFVFYMKLNRGTHFSGVQYMDAAILFREIINSMFESQPSDNFLAGGVETDH
jgi:hypothetical protein